jgi:hypothetical protein
MNIKEIAFRLNELSSGYIIGSLQRIRKTIKGLKSIPGTEIFVYKTQTNKSIFIEDRYAFHYGGRSEFQFNIGFESHRNLFRYGLAFSLEKGKSMKDASIFFDRIDKFNSYIKLYPKMFSEMSYWYYKDGKHSNILKIQTIPDSLKEEGVFIFIGKYLNKSENEIEEADLHNILSTFDELLEPYLYVENDTQKFKLDKTKSNTNFLFAAGFNDNLPEETEGESRQRKYAIILKHNSIKKNICKHLEKVYGKGFIGAENQTPFGTQIDIVVNKNGKNTFYEIKTSDSIRLCIREALSQLMEYSYWPDINNATKLIIVSENIITDEAQKYLYKLRNEFKVPVWYQQYNNKTKTLEQTMY